MVKVTYFIIKNIFYNFIKGLNLRVSNEQATIPKLTNEQIIYWDNYIFTSWDLIKKEVIGNSKICRFCGTKDSKSFRKIAHTIPESLGNKTLTSLDECDICNETFSKLENDFNNYLAPFKALLGIKGKRGVSKYQAKQKNGVNVLIENDQSSNALHLHIEHSQLIGRYKFSSPVYKLSGLKRKRIIINKHIKNKNKIIIKYKSMPFIPVAIYKCLTKMALSLMDTNDLQYFKSTMCWIREFPHQKRVEGLKSFISFRPKTPFPFITCFILKRKNNNSTIPYMQFVLCFSHFAFQIVVPTGNETDLVIHNFPILHHKGFSPIVYQEEFLEVKKCTKEFYCTMTFDTCKNLN